MCFADTISIEHEAFVQFYDKLTKVFHNKSYISEFASNKIIQLSDVHHISNLPDNDRAMCILKKILDPLESNETQNFYKMLKVMQGHNNPHVEKLVEDIKAFISMDSCIKSTETASAQAEGMYACVW